MEDLTILRENWQEKRAEALEVRVEMLELVIKMQESKIAELMVEGGNYNGVDRNL